jgi:dipeptide/tripeptide permease
MVDDHMRGRVMSLFTMAFTGTTPFSSLVMGWVAQRVGSPWVLTFTGLVCLLTMWIFHRQLPRIRDAVARARKESLPTVPLPEVAGSGVGNT